MDYIELNKRTIKASDGLPLGGFVRLNELIAPKGPIPMSRSSWWKGVRERRFPQPIKLGPRTTVWRCDDIRAWLAEKVQ